MTPANTSESIGGPLEALRHAGTITGLCLAQRNEVIENHFSMPDSNLTNLVSVVDDILTYFDGEGRNVDQMAFGYDAGKVVIISDGDYRIIVTHQIAEEIDFIAKASRAFLIDYQLGVHAKKLRPKTARQVLRAPAPRPEEPEVAVHTGPVQPILPTPTPATAISQPTFPPAAASERVAAPPQSLPPQVQSLAPPSAPQSPAPPVSVPANDSTPLAEPQLVVATPEHTSDRQAIFTAKNRPEEDLETNQNRGSLAPDQPENTLPPPRRPRNRT